MLEAEVKQASKRAMLLRHYCCTKRCRNAWCSYTQQAETKRPPSPEDSPSLSQLLSYQHHGANIDSPETASLTARHTPAVEEVVHSSSDPQCIHPSEKALSCGSCGNSWCTLTQTNLLLHYTHVLFYVHSNNGYILPQKTNVLLAC